MIHFLKIAFRVSQIKSNTKQQQQPRTAKPRGQKGNESQCPGAKKQSTIKNSVRTPLPLANLSSRPGGDGARALALRELWHSSPLQHSYISVGNAVGTQAVGELQGAHSYTNS